MLVLYATNHFLRPQVVTRSGHDKDPLFQSTKSEYTTLWIPCIASLLPRLRSPSAPRHATPLQPRAFPPIPEHLHHTQPLNGLDCNPASRLPPKHCLLSSTQGCPLQLGQRAPQVWTLKRRHPPRYDGIASPAFGSNTRNVAWDRAPSANCLNSFCTPTLRTVKTLKVSFCCRVPHCPCFRPISILYLPIFCRDKMYCWMHLTN